MAPFGCYLLPLLVCYSSILPSLCLSFSTQKLFINNRLYSRHRSHHTHLYVSQARSSSSSSSSGLSDDARLKRTSGLVKWAESCGAKIGPVEISKCNNGGGLGLQTSRSVKQNDILMEVPTDMVLQSGSSSSSSSTTLLKNNNIIESIGDDSYTNAPWWAQLSIQINALSSHSSSNNNNNNNDDDVSSWINTLPQSFNTPLHWSSSTLTNDLQYDYLQRRIAIQQSQWTSAYNNLVQPQRLPFTLSYDDFVWGCEMARSRAFSGSFSSETFNPTPFVFTAVLVVVYLGLGLGSVEQAANGAGLVFCASILKDFVFPKLFKNKEDKGRVYVISPLLDMANHDARNENAKVALEYFTGGYSLTATRDLTQGESVLISYGARSNDQLLQYYGFVERDNPHDVYIMPPLRSWDVSRLEEVSGRTFGVGRLEKLERAGLLGKEWTDEEAVGIVVSRATGIDPAIMQALRALVSTDEEWMEAKESVGAFSVEFSEENELVARRVAKTALEMELEKMGTTVEEDERLLKQSRAGGKKALTMRTEEELMAIQFRIEKKRVLLETIDKLL